MADLFQLVTVVPLGDPTDQRRFLPFTQKYNMYFVYTDDLHYKDGRNWVSYPTFIPTIKEKGDKIVGFVVPTLGKDGITRLEVPDPERSKEINYWAKISKQFGQSYDPVPLVEIQEVVKTVEIPQKVSIIPRWQSVAMVLILLSSVIMPLVARGG